ncbi:MAG: universal stress protein [Pseudomonadota bacterium]
MSYKTVLVQLDHSAQARQRIGIAATIALAEGAHLVGTVSSGIARYAFHDHAFEPGLQLGEGRNAALRAAASRALDAFDSAAASFGVASHERRQTDGDAGADLALQARYSDLVVIGQPDPAQAAFGSAPDLPEFVMLSCARPVLIVPYAGQFEHVGKNVLIAWDGSAQATRAISGALPLLRRAERVTLAVFNPDSKHGDQPGADIALYLARHQVKVEVMREYPAIDVGNAMLSLASDLDVDLIVMGGYGHARVRQLLLGGVTKTLLETMTVPVLMAH